MFEGVEEMESELLNTAVDIAVNQRDSELQKAIASYMKNGDSEMLAVTKAWGDVLSDVISAGIAGAFSGMGMSSVHQGINTVATGREYRDVADAVIQTGLERPTDSRAYKNAVKLNEKKNISDYALGKQHRLNAEQSGESSAKRFFCYRET